jgi:riboflavin kinase
VAEATKINQTHHVFQQVLHTMNHKSHKTLTFKGKIFSGKSEGAKYLRLSWVQQQIKEKLGFVPYSGTLNIELSESSKENRKELDNVRAIEISPQKGFCRARCFKACLMDGIKCAVVIPEIPDYPQNVIEIIAPENLREKLHLEDDDPVHVKICF